MRSGYTEVSVERTTLSKTKNQPEPAFLMMIRRPVLKTTRYHKYRYRQKCVPWHVLQQQGDEAEPPKQRADTLFTQQQQQLRRLTYKGVNEEAFVQRMSASTLSSFRRNTGRKKKLVRLREHRPRSNP